MLLPTQKAINNSVDHYTQKGKHANNGSIQPRLPYSQEYLISCFSKWYQSHLKSACSLLKSQQYTSFSQSTSNIYKRKRKLPACIKSITSISRTAYTSSVKLLFQWQETVYGYCCLYHSCLQICQMYILPFIRLSVYTSTRLELISLKKLIITAEDECHHGFCGQFV